MSKKHILWVLALAITVLLCGCKETIAPAENQVSKQVYSFSSFEQSSDVTVDGVLDEQLWQNKKWFKNTYITNAGGLQPIMELTAIPTEHGVYVGSVVYDSNLTCDGQRNPAKNSCWELYFGACNVGEDLFSEAYAGKWTLQSIFVDMMGDSYSLYTHFDRMVVVEGELNSGNTTKATLEMFLPWETLRVDITKGIPETVGILPCYRAPLEIGGSTAWMSPAASSLTSTTDMYLFDSTGYINADMPGTVLGDGFYGYAKTKGWDVSQAENGIVRCDRGGSDKIFFKEMFGDNFLIEATVIPVKAIRDEWPKAGFIFQKADGQHHTVWLDAQGADGLVSSINETKNFPGYQLVTLNQNGGWNQKTLYGYDRINPNAASQEGVKLTVVKYGSNFWYFADGKFLTCENVDFMDGKSMPGFFSLGMETVYKDFSCKELNQEDLSAYLNERSIYLIDASVEGPGGTVFADKDSLVAGEGFTVSFVAKSGYKLSSVLVNDQEMLDYVKANAQQGQFSIENVQSSQNVVLKFEQCSEISFTGSVTNGEKGVAATMVLEGVEDRSFYYEIEVSAKKEFDIKLPAGIYRMKLTATGCKGLEKTIELTADTNEQIVLEQSAFAENLKVNGKPVKSALDQFDLSREHENKVYGDYALGTHHHDYLYFNGVGTDFVVTTTLTYTTEFDPYGSYQKDLIGGFGFTDGTNTSDIWARDTGIIYIAAKWQYVMGIFGKSILMYPNPKSAEFTVAKLGETVYIYLDGRQVYTAPWSQIVPNIPADGEIAVALSMVADKSAQLQYSNFGICFDTNEVTDYVNTH